MSAKEELSRLSGSYFINGKFEKSTSAVSFDVVDPATENVIGQIPDCTSEEVANVIAAANQAQKKWAKVNSLERAELMHEAANKLREIQPVLAEMMTREMGKPYKETFDEISWTITSIDYYAEVGRHNCGQVLGPAVDGQFHYTIKEPMGVVVAILPFNYPIALLTWEAAAAIAAGNSVVVKPSEAVTLSTLKFMEAFDCLPDGVIQCTSGAVDVAKHLVESPDTHMVAFTGGVATGRIVAKACADTFKPYLIEASGNDPFIVMPSANMDMAVRGALFAANLNCGQVCTSGERFYIHEDIHDEFVAKLIKAVKGLRIGNGLDKIDIGPMVNSRERASFFAKLERAVEQGAKIECGGKVPAGMDTGWFIEPSVLTGVTSDMDILQAESFGPTAAICKVSSFDEAIELANASKYGLGATVFTTDLNESNRAINEIVAGMVWINAPLLDNDAGPFGGRKLSGIGRQLGAEGLDTFRHTKMVMVDPASNPQDFWWFPYQDNEAFSGEK